MPVEISRRRAHSPAAISASATMRAEQDAHAGAEPALLDRVADQENAAERQREAADPHHPLGAEALFQRRRGAGGGGGGRIGGKGGGVLGPASNARRRAASASGGGGMTRSADAGGAGADAAAASRAASSVTMRVCSERTSWRAFDAMTMATMASTGNAKASSTATVISVSSMPAPDHDARHVRGWRGA